MPEDIKKDRREAAVNICSEKVKHAICEILSVATFLEKRKKDSGLPFLETVCTDIKSTFSLLYKEVAEGIKKDSLYE